MYSKKVIIQSFFGAPIELILYGQNFQTIEERADAIQNGEAPVQIKEGCFYEYKIEDGFLLQSSETVVQSNVTDTAGRIVPGIYVGTLSIDVLKASSLQKCAEFKLEVQSVKTSYREDYRYMLEEITERCTDLVMLYKSPVSQFFEVDFTADANTLYQRFAFTKSIIDSPEFNNSIHKILASPVTTWTESAIIKDVRNARRFTRATIHQLTSAGNRLDLPQNHGLKKIIPSVPSKVRITNKKETVDTPENRFVKLVLTSFRSFFSDFKMKVKDSERIMKESALLENNLEQYLSHSIFKEISSPDTLPLNSPILQRKEGYREILRGWLMFHLAANLVWRGGDDVYAGNKRDVATLYEYWLFFKLLEIMSEVFKIAPLTIEDLIEESFGGLGLKLKRGKFLPIRGVYDAEKRKLNVEFGYNKTFIGDSRYPAAGSWTRSLRPDYTLSIWPFGVEQQEAEKEELIVHIHFDAKYKVEDLQTMFGVVDDLEEEKEQQMRGTYKRADLLKMHTYKDAIRRTAGAYVLYPGSEEKYLRVGFHELIPGLGAFSIRPSRSNNGIEELKKFLRDVLHHFMNRVSQREKISLDTYETYKNSKSDELNEILPEAYGVNRDFFPGETYVLIGYYKDESHYKWIVNESLYNARAEDDRGSLKLGPREAGAKYLLLHSRQELQTGRLFKITDRGPRVFSKQTLIKRKYPTEPSQPYYLVYSVEKTKEVEFLDKAWDVSRLEGFKSRRNSVLPFAVSLTELMKTIIKDTHE